MYTYDRNFIYLETVASKWNSKTVKTRSLVVYDTAIRRESGSLPLEDGDVVLLLLQVSPPLLLPPAGCPGGAPAALRPLQLHVVGVAPAHRLLRQLQRLLLRPFI